MKINLNRLIVKIVLFGFALVLLSLVIFSSVFLVNQRTELSNQILDKGLIFSEFSARSIYDDYISFYTQSSDDTLTLFRAQLEDKLSRNNDIINVELASVNGRILFDSAELKTGKYSATQVRTINDAESLRLLKNETTSYRSMNLNGKQVTEIFVPIKELSGSHILAMRYILSFDSFDRSMMAIYRQIGLSSLIVLILVFLLAIPFYSNLIKPISQLSSLAKKIGKGDLNAKLAINPGDGEIGILAANFNTMVDELRLAKEKSLDYNKRLEQELNEKAEMIRQEKENFSRETEHYRLEIEELKKKNEDLKKLNKFAIKW